MTPTETCSVLNSSRRNTESLDCKYRMFGSNAISSIVAVGEDADVTLASDLLSVCGFACVSFEEESLLSVLDMRDTAPGNLAKELSSSA